MVTDERGWVGFFFLVLVCLLSIPPLYELQSGFALTQVLTPPPKARNVTRSNQSASFRPLHSPDLGLVSCDGPMGHSSTFCLRLRTEIWSHTCSLPAWPLIPSSASKFYFTCWWKGGIVWLEFPRDYRAIPDGSQKDHYPNYENPQCRTMRDI